MTILVAAHPAGTVRLQKVLAGHELTFVETVEQAKQALARRAFSCVVLGVQFDESRVLRLLDELRSQRRLTAPVVCVVGIKGRLSHIAIGAFDQAARALGANAVLDMTDFPDDQQGNARLRGVIDRLMPASRAVSPPRAS